MRYQFVLIAVSAGGVIAALLVFATYVFLRRRVLQPRRRPATISIASPAAT